MFYTFCKTMVINGQPQPYNVFYYYTACVGSLLCMIKRSAILKCQSILKYTDSRQQKFGSSIDGWGCPLHCWRPLIAPIRTAVAADTQIISPHKSFLSTFTATPDSSRQCNRRNSTLSAHTVGSNFHDNRAKTSTINNSRTADARNASNN